jgi:hypothetical protein
MNMKHITSLTTFALAFAVSVTIAGFFQVKVSKSTAQKITQVLAQDIANGNARTAKRCRKPANDLAVRTQDYVNASTSIETIGLPNDFQSAWKKHMEAWRNHSNFLNSVDSMDSNTLEIDQYNTDEINRTWWEVLRIARKHGAEIPAGAY